MKKTNSSSLAFTVGGIHFRVGVVGGVVVIVPEGGAFAGIRTKLHPEFEDVPGVQEVEAELAEAVFFSRSV